MGVRRDEPPGDWPTGHIGWSYTGVPEFEGRAGSFLAEGTTYGERLVFVADDPRPELWPKELVSEGSLVIHSTSEAYGAEGVVDPVALGMGLEEAVADAVAEGYTGLRVVADNTSVVATPEQLTAWMCWEKEADRLMGVLPVTGVCAFDRLRVDPGVLRAVMGIHRTRPPHEEPAPRSDVPGDDAPPRANGSKGR